MTNRARVNEVERVAQHPDIQFRNHAQREKFLKLMGKKMRPTVYLDLATARRMGIHTMLRGMFSGTGLQGLFGPGSLSFDFLTLEFLSSLVDMGNETIAFRIMNRERQLTYAELAEAWNFTYVEGDPSVVPPGFNKHRVWRSMTGEDRCVPSRMSPSSIQHPVLRLYVRTLIGTIFARSDASKMNSSELWLVGQYLNLDGQQPFRLNVVDLVVKHLLVVAKGDKLSVIGVGGLITKLAVEKFGFDPARFKNKSLSPDDEVPYLDPEYLHKRHSWVMEAGHHVYHWVVKEGWCMRLPNPELPPIRSFPQRTRSGSAPLIFYTVPHGLLYPTPQPVTTTRMPRRRPAPTPEPTSSSGTHSTYPTPFHRAQETHLRINTELTMYGLHNMLISGGHIPREGPHPTWYRGPEGDFGGYPGGIFDYYGVNQAEWGPNYASNYSGLGGNWLPQFSMPPNSDPMRASGSGSRRNETDEEEEEGGEDEEGNNEAGLTTTDEED